MTYENFQSKSKTSAAIGSATPSPTFWLAEAFSGGRVSVTVDFSVLRGCQRGPRRNRHAQW